jgi:hypothetical protein
VRFGLGGVELELEWNRNGGYPCALSSGFAMCIWVDDGERLKSPWDCLSDYMYSLAVYCE